MSARSGTDAGPGDGDRPLSTDPLDAETAAGATMRGGAIRAAGWGLGALLSLVSIPLLVRHLGVADFGRYVAVLAVVNIAALASDLGLAGLALREWSAADAADRPRVMRTLLGLRIAVATAGAVAAIAFTLAAGYSGGLVAGTAIAIVGLFAQVFGDFALVGLAGRLQFGRVAIVELTRSALGTLGVAALVLLDAGLVWFFAAYALASIAAAALAIRFAEGAVPLTPRLRRAEWRPLLADTAAYAAATAVYVVYFRVIMLVVAIEATARDTGLFATAYRVIEFAAAVGGVLAGTATPILARTASRDPARLPGEARRVVLTCVAAGAGAALALAVGAGVLMDAIGGGSTDDAAAILRILAPSVLTTFAAFGMGAVLLVMRRYRELLAINVVAIAIALGAALALVPGEGARGGAVALVIGEVFMAAAQGVVLTRALRGLGYHRPSAGRN